MSMATVTTDSVLPSLTCRQVCGLAEPWLRQMRATACDHLLGLLNCRNSEEEKQHRALAERALDRAVAYRLYAYADVMRYLVLSAVLGEDFERQSRFAIPGRFLQQTGWPSQLRMRHVMDMICRILESDFQPGAGPDEARLLIGFDKKLNKTNGADGPIAVTRAPQITGAPIRVRILDGPECFYAMTPGIRRPVLELRAAGLPEGGFYRWKVESEEPVVLGANGSYAWIRPAKPGEARVTVTYYVAGERVSATTLVRVRPAPRIRISPQLCEFGQVALGQKTETRRITVANVGGSPMRIGRINAPLGFEISGDSVSETMLAPDQKKQFRLRFCPQTAGLIDVELVLACDAGNQHDNRVQLKGKACWPAPRISVAATPDGPAITSVAPGLWDAAWQARDGALYNGGGKNDFISRDSRSFHIRVEDSLAAAKDLETITVSWWTRRDRDEGDENRPGNAHLTLTRRGDTNCYVSCAVMLATDEDDYHQSVHTGLPGGVVVASGSADHRLRLVSVDERDGLNRHLFIAYQRFSQDAESESWHVALPLFERRPDRRRRVTVNLINVRVAPGGRGVASAKALAFWQDRIRTIMARCGVLVSFNTNEVDPPSDCRNWPRRIHKARDAGVETGLGISDGGRAIHVPSSSQLQLIDAYCPEPDQVYMFILDGIYHPLEQGLIEGEAFYQARTPIPDHLDGACGALNVQYLARGLAMWLCSSAHRFRENGWTQTRRNRLRRALDEALELAAEMAGKHGEHLAGTFLEALELVKSDKPAYVAAAIDAAREDVYPVFYKPATLAAMIEAARGCIFLADPDLISPYQAAHQLAHVLIDDNKINGHYDLTKPRKKARAGTPGYDMPGPIDGRNLMHRFGLEPQPDPVCDPKRLWDRAAVNKHRARNEGGVELPAQITAILENKTFVKPYLRQDRELGENSGAPGVRK